jgi:hypothetical protein
MSQKTCKPKASFILPPLVGLLAISRMAFVPGMAFAQTPPDTQPSAEGEQQPEGQEPPQQTRQPGQQPDESAPAPRPGWHRFGPPRSDARRADPPPAQQEELPAQLTLQAGSYMTVRVDRYLSSDKNRVGDSFTATLMQPIVVNGFVVARRGQILGGRVAVAQKAGRVKGVSRLAIELTDMTLVDGTQMPIRTQLESERGPTGKAKDAAIVATSAGIGAAIGAGAGGGAGAAIGAGGGALASTLGVLLTRGRPTEIYPETELTFRIASPVVINTTRAPQAFYVAGPNDYGRGNGEREPGPPRLRSRACYGCLPPPPYYAYGPPYYSYWWGPSFNFWYTPGFFYGHRFHRHGFRY